MTRRSLLLLVLLLASAVVTSSVGVTTTEAMDHNGTSHPTNNDDPRETQATTEDMRSLLSSGNIFIPNAAGEPINLLVLTADQLRYDVLSFVQNRLPQYRNKLKVRTPHLDRLASQGVYFTDAYSQSSSCVPARATLRSGCTLERHGLYGNTALREQRREKRRRSVRSFALEGTTY